MQKTRIALAIAVLATLSTVLAGENPTAGVPAVAKTGKPLKIFILAGQSNMQGQAKVRTIERLNLTEDSKQMYQAMVKLGKGTPLCQYRVVALLK